MYIKWDNVKNFDENNQTYPAESQNIVAERCGNLSEEEEGQQEV